MNDFNIDGYVYNALKSGRNIDDIVKIITDSINNVNKVFQEEQEKEQYSAKRLELAQGMIDALTKYLKFRFPEFNFREVENMSAEEYADTVDKSVDIMMGVSRDIESIKKKTQVIKEHLAVDKDPLSEFLRKNGLK